MVGGNTVGCQIVAPAWREVFVDDQPHDASS
jgi:hypothetical protein